MNDLKDMQKLVLSSVYGKVVKSYALDTETIEYLEQIAKDLGLKSRSEVLRYILKEFNKKWQKDKQRNEQN